MTFIEIITSNVGAILSLLISLGIYAIVHAKTEQKTDGRIQELEKANEKHNHIHELLDVKMEGVNVIKVTLAQIQTDILWIKEKLTEKN